MPVGRRSGPKLPKKSGQARYRYRGATLSML
jgi:hypothetical protein